MAAPLRHGQQQALGPGIRLPLAVSDLSAHPAFLASEFAPTFTCFLRTHSGSPHQKRTSLLTRHHVSDSRQVAAEPRERAKEVRAGARPGLQPRLARPATYLAPVLREVASLSRTTCQGQVAGPAFLWTLPSLARSRFGLVSHAGASLPLRIRVRTLDGRWKTRGLVPIAIENTSGHTALGAPVIASPLQRVLDQRQQHVRVVRLAHIESAAGGAAAPHHVLLVAAADNNDRDVARIRRID